LLFFPLFLARKKSSSPAHANQAISCHCRKRKALLVTSLTDVSSAIASRPFSRRELNPINRARDASRPEWPRLITSPTAPVRQQCWSQGLLLRKTRRFFPSDKLSQCR